MKYVYDDGGRQSAGYKGSAGDCCCRAFAIVSGRPYQEIYDLINAFASKERKGTRKRGMSDARSGVHKATAQKVAAALGFKWTPTMHIGSGCTVHLNENELPSGRIVCNVSKHYTAVIDGIIRDTFNPSDRGSTVYPLSTPQDQLPKGARKLSNGNGYVYAPERCVYGYWQSA